MDIQIHDDGSTTLPERLECRGDKPFTLQTWNENVGYVAHINRIVAEHYQEGSYLLLLNYDTDFTKAVPSWLPWMVDALAYRHRTDHAAGIGPLTTCGLIDQTPAMVMGKKLMIGADCRELQVGIAPSPSLSGFCVLLHPAFVRARLDACGYLLRPELNRIAYDDLDLSYWARERGWTLWVHHGVLVLHDARKEDRAGLANDAGKAAMEKLWGPEWEKRGNRFVKPLDLHRAQPPRIIPPGVRPSSPLSFPADPRFRA